MPLFETGGGYFYDFVELLFFSLAVYFAYHGRLLLLILIISFAELNKESFLFFIFTLYPLIRRTQTIKTSIFTVGLAVLIAGLIYLITRSTYSANEGSNVVFQFYYTIKFVIPLLILFLVYFVQRKILEPIKRKIFFAGVMVIFLIIFIKIPELSSVYFPFIHSGEEFSSYTYSVITGERLFIPHILMIFYIVKTQWNRLSLHFKQHAISAMVIISPLWIMFCAPGELRNLSMLYPSFIIMLSFYIHSEIKRYYDLI